MLDTAIKLKESKWVNWVAKSIIPALILFLLQWHWQLNDRIARIEENNKQDRVQWQAIKQISDHDEEQEVRLRVAEKIQDWSIMAGILRNLVEEDSLEEPDPAEIRKPLKPRIDVKKLFDDVKKEKSKRPTKEVDQYIQQQMAK